MTFGECKVYGKADLITRFSRKLGKIRNINGEEYELIGIPLLGDESEEEM